MQGIMANKEAILAFFRQKPKPVSLRDMSAQMNLSRPEARALKRVLREMLRGGDLVLTKKGLYGPSKEMNLVSGYYEAHRDGFGFVITENPGERDIFIPPGEGGGAMDGDRVMVRIENWKRRGGRIIRILERSVTRIVGTYETEGPAAYVRPKSRSVSFGIAIPPQERKDAKNGDVVVAEITAYPTDRRPPAGKIIKVIVKPEDPASEVEAIIDEFNLPRSFPRAVSEQARALLEVAPGAGTKRAVRPRPAEKRKDLRSLTTVTIDGERAKDFDDAVSINRTEQGFTLWVHIADVGHFVEWGSALDLEARKRGTSVYFPDRVIPMLPKELSEDLCSLKPDLDRFAFTVEMDFDRNGIKTAARFYPSLIRSDARLTYTSVSKVLVDRDPGELQRYQNLERDLGAMGELCKGMRSLRMARGSLDFDLPEPEILLDLQGNPDDIVRAERNFAHMLIEEFMIAANESVAEYLEKHDIPALYRIHEEPDPVRMEDVLRVIRPLGIMKRKTLRPKDLPRLIQDIANAPEREIVNYVVLRSLKQARYSPVNAGHFGLASKAYCHFTSPIRRYPDLIVHRILREVFSTPRMLDKRRQELEMLLPDIAFHSSHMERLSDDAEREVVDAMRVWFMKDKIGMEFPSTVIGVTPNGVRVRLNEFYVDGFLRLSDLTDDFYQFNDRNMTLSGRHTGRTFKIGQDLMLRVDRIDHDEREVIFGIVETKSRTKR